jgi:hypothetical protein
MAVQVDEPDADTVADPHVDGASEDPNPRIARDESHLIRNPRLESGRCAVDGGEGDDGARQDLVPLHGTGPAG